MYKFLWSVFLFIQVQTKNRSYFWLNAIVGEWVKQIWIYHRIWLNFPFKSFSIFMRIHFLHERYIDTRSDDLSVQLFLPTKNQQDWILLFCRHSFKIIKWDWWNFFPKNRKWLTLQLMTKKESYSNASLKLWIERKYATEFIPVKSLFFCGKDTKRYH